MGSKNCSKNRIKLAKMGSKVWEKFLHKSGFNGGNTASWAQKRWRKVTAKVRSKSGSWNEIKYAAKCGSSRFTKVSLTGEIRPSGHKIGGGKFHDFGAFWGPKNNTVLGE